MLLIYMGPSLLLPEYVYYDPLGDESLSASCEILQSGARQRSSKAMTARYERVPNVITVCPTGDRAPVSGVNLSTCIDSVVGGKKRTWLEMYGL